MPIIVHLNADNRAMSFATGSDYTTETVVFEGETNLFVEGAFDSSNIAKIYNFETNTFAADDQTAAIITAMNTPPVEEEEEAE